MLFDDYAVISVPKYFWLKILSIGPKKSRSVVLLINNITTFFFFVNGEGLKIHENGTNVPYVL